MKTEEILNVISNQYGIRASNYKVISRLMFRESLYLEDENGNKYIIKKYPKIIKTQELESIAKFYMELYQQGIKTNKVVIKKSSGIFFEMRDGKYIVFTYLEGIQCSTTAFSLKYGKALKDLHGEMSFLNLSLAQISTQSQIEQCKRHIYEWEQIDEVSLIIRSKFFKIVETCEKYRVMTPSIIHGDCTRNNCIVTNNIITFIDFDNFKIGDPLEDLANAANCVLYDSGIKSFNYKKEIIIQLFCQYGLMDEDFERIKNYMKINCIIELYKHRENYRYLRRTPGTKNYLEKLIWIINYLEGRESESLFGVSFNKG